MKKFILCLLIPVLAVSITGCTFEISGKEFTIGKKDTKTEEDIGIHYVDDKWYTRDEIEWKQMYPEEEIVYTENYDTRSKVDYFVLNTKQTGLSVAMLSPTVSLPLSGSTSKTVSVSVVSFAAIIWLPSGDSVRNLG